MTIKQTKIGWGFWLKWVLATTVGFIICLFILFYLGKAVAFMIGYPHEDDFFYWLAYNIHFIATCAGVGIIQWLILRRRVSRVGLWAPAMVAGFVLASVLLYAPPITRNYLLEVKNIFARNIGWIMFLALGGTIAGLFQWFFLRRQISRAGWWVLASAVGWSLGEVVWQLGDWFLFERFGFGPAGGLLRFLRILNYSGLFFAIIMGVITGGALVWLLRQPLNVK
jgi:hypothetical protein